MIDKTTYDPEPKERETQPPLELGPIPGVLPFAGHRSPLSRSSVAHKISMVLPTPATKGVPRVYHFESAHEAAVGLEAVISAELYELEVQLPPIPYQDWQGTWRKHSFDARITFRSGFRRAVFVRNGTSLRRPKVQTDIAAIFAATSAGFADDKVVVNGDGYTRGYRDNLYRGWEATKRSDREADDHLLDVVRRTTFWDLGQLIRSCELSSARAFDAALRLIGRKALIEIVQGAITICKTAGSTTLRHEHFVQWWVARTKSAPAPSPFLHRDFQTMYRRDRPLLPQIAD